MQDLLTRYPLAVIPFFLLFWCVVNFLIAALTGWSTLARRFRMQSPFTSPTWRFQSARMRWSTHYGSCLTVGADPTGLMLSVFFLFRVGHPPLFVPWSEISVVERSKSWLGRQVKLQLGREEQIPLLITGSLADRIQSAAGSSWPIESPT